MASVAVIHKGMNRQAGVSTVLVDQMEDKRGGEINNGHVWMSGENILMREKRCFDH